MSDDGDVTLVVEWRVVYRDRGQDVVWSDGWTYVEGALRSRDVAARSWPNARVEVRTVRSTPWLKLST